MSATNITSKCRIASIGPDDADDSTSRREFRPDHIFGKDKVVTAAQSLGRIPTSSASLARSAVIVSITSSCSTSATCAVCCHVFSLLSPDQDTSLARQELSGHPASTPTCCGQDHRVPRGRRTASSLRTPRRLSSHRNDTGAPIPARRRCASLNTMMWSKHSRRIEPMSRST